MRSYGRLAAQRHQLDREIARLEEEKNRAEYQARVVELAISLRERWQRRTEMDHELAALGPQTPMPEDAVPRLDALNARIEKQGRRIERLQRQRAGAAQRGLGPGNQ